MRIGQFARIISNAHDRVKERKPVCGGINRHTFVRNGRSQSEARTGRIGAGAKRFAAPAEKSFYGWMRVSTMSRIQSLR